MKSLIKVILILGLVSGSSFFIVQSTGLITIERIDFWFNEIRSIDPLYIGMAVLCLMFIDLFQFNSHAVSPECISIQLVQFECMCRAVGNLYSEFEALVIP